MKRQSRDFGALWVWNLLKIRADTKCTGLRRHLLDYLKENNKMISLIPLDDRHMHIDASEVLSALRRGRGEWESDVPEVVARRIIERKLMGFDSE